ncbi:FHA domain-containing protein [Prosthecomicrobium sp. N25]|uniref:FHA domain-containing protein n=1 Tax=Prosthecomicrobium sp. N25 TaxID=3129254 RepID=UPI003077E28D
MLDWIATAGTQLAVLVLIVVAVGIGIAATVRREREAAALQRAAAAERGSAPQPVITRQQPRIALAVLEFEDDPGVVSIDRPRVTIGRHSDDDIRVKDVTVSRHHAVLQLNAAGLFEIHNQTADRAEPNPMLVNGVYREHAELADGDLVTIGGVTFRFRRELARSAA